MSERISREEQAALREVVWKDPGRVGGALCFRGTRVSVQTLADYLKAGDSLEYFLEGFPTVEREQAQGFLDLAVRLADEHTRPEGAFVSDEKQSV